MLSILSTSFFCKKKSTYALNLNALWSYFHHKKLSENELRKSSILLAGSGSFSPYPTKVANPKSQVVAIDLSDKNLKRANLHSLLHGQWNNKFVKGDISELGNLLPNGSLFNFIDCFGVLHHLPYSNNDRENLALKTLIELKDHLKPGGFIRLMVYNKQARKRVELLRHLFKLLKVDSVLKIRSLIIKAKWRQLFSNKKSLFLNLIKSEHETTFSSGLSDLFLHPYAKTFKVEELLELIYKAGLQPLLFSNEGIHHKPINQQIEIMKGRETEYKIRSNLILYLGKRGDHFASLNEKLEKRSNSTFPELLLNPLLKKHFSFISLLFPYHLKLIQKFPYTLKTISLSYKDRIKVYKIFKRVKSKKRGDFIKESEWNYLQNLHENLILLVL